MIPYFSCDGDIFSIVAADMNERHKEHKELNISLPV